MAEDKDKLEVFDVPKSLYDEAFDTIHRKSEFPLQENYYHTNPVRCFQAKFKTFDTYQPHLKICNLTEAARQAFEDRNFKVLYEIVKIGLELKNPRLTYQLYKYLYSAVELDPKIEDKGEMLMSLVKSYHLLEKDKDAKKVIENAHLLIDNTKKEEDAGMKAEMSDSDHGLATENLYF